MPTSRLAVSSTARGWQNGAAFGMESTVDAADRLTDVLTPAVNELFSVTLDLASMATSQSDDRVAQRLLNLMDRIDDAVCQLRDGVLTELAADPVSVHVRSCLGAQLAAG